MPTALVALARRLRPDKAERERALVGASGLLDPSYYLIQAPDVHAAGADPVAHFCQHGWREGRRPNPCFDPAWYREVYLPAKPAVNPLVHYIRRGEAAGCRPIAYFDPPWYRRTYRVPHGTPALAHYLGHRRSQRFAPNPDFDLAFFMARHGTEIGPNRDPFAHLIRLGAARDLDPSPTFSSAAYRAASMPTPDNSVLDGSAAGLAAYERRVPLLHFLDAQARASAPAVRSRAARRFLLRLPSWS